MTLGIWASGCGPKEAADPHELLAEEYERAGVDDESGEPERDPGLEPATRAECESATRRLFALGGSGDPDGKLVRERVDECLARGTSRREAKCVAKASTEEAVELCPE